MSKLTVSNLKGEKVADITLNKELWGIEPNDVVLYDAINLTRSSLRQGSANTKTRSEVAGGGRKPWRQKGTGRARQGSIRAPQWYHGGIVFGPKPRDFDKKMNKKERRLALKSALAYKFINKELVVVEDFNITTNKTKDFLEQTASLDLTKNVLIVVDKLSDNLILATRNIKNIILLESKEINTYDIIAADKMVVTKEAIKLIEEALV